MQQVNVENLLQFSDVEMCKKFDTFCPVLSSALKGAMGGKDRKADGETPSDHSIRTMCYGAIYKARFVFFNF